MHEKKQKKLKIPPTPRGMRRVKVRSGKIYRKKCPCGKGAVFSSYDRAMGAAHRLIKTNVKRVYYCAEGGGFHFTGSPFMSRKQRRDEFIRRDGDQNDGD